MSDRTSMFTALWAWMLTIVAVASLLGYGFYLQYVEYLDPCPLCITQRLFYFLIAVMSFLAVLFFKSPRGQQIFAGLFILSACGGIATAGRQVWLQHLPKDQVPECGLGLYYWLENEPFLQTLTLLFKGDGNCAEVQWQFLNLSIGEWSLAWFIGFFLLGCWLFIRLGREARRKRTA